MIKIKENLTKQELYQTAVMGSLWALIEISVGTWLHISKIPLRGFFLSLIAVIILVIAKKIIGYKGSLVLIGVICASIKTATSGAFMINPIFAILIESVIVEIIFVIGKYNFITAILSGMAALFYTFIHSLIAQFFFFGFEIIKIYESIFSKILNFQSIDNKTAYLIIGIYGLLHLVSGGITGLLGYNIAFKTNNLIMEKK